MVYESAVQKPKHCLTCCFLHPLVWTDVIPTMTTCPDEVDAVGDELVAVVPIPYDDRVLLGVDQDVERVLVLKLYRVVHQVVH